MTREELFETIRRAPVEKLKELFLGVELRQIREDVLKNVDALQVFQNKTTIRTQILVEIVQYAIIELISAAFETSRKENKAYILTTLAAIFDGAQASIQQKIEKERLEDTKKGNLH